MADERSSGVNEIAALYDRWAASYDSDPNATRDLCAQVIRREFWDRGLGDVLELGCGTPGLKTRGASQLRNGDVPSGL